MLILVIKHLSPLIFFPLIFSSYLLFSNATHSRPIDFNKRQKEISNSKCSWHTSQFELETWTDYTWVRHCIMNSGIIIKYEFDNRVDLPHYYKSGNRIGTLGIEQKYIVSINKYHLIRYEIEGDKLFKYTCNGDGNFKCLNDLRKQLLGRRITK